MRSSYIPIPIYSDTDTDADTDARDLSIFGDQRLVGKLYNEMLKRSEEHGMDNMDVQALGETDTGSTSTPAHEPHTMRKRSERSRSRMRAIAPSAECRDTANCITRC